MDLSASPCFWELWGCQLPEGSAAAPALPLQGNLALLSVCLHFRLFYGPWCLLLRGRVHETQALHAHLAAPPFA